MGGFLIATANVFAVAFAANAKDAVTTEGERRRVVGRGGRRVNAGRCCKYQGDSGDELHLVATMMWIYTQ